MTEADARERIAANYGAEVLAGMSQFLNMVIAENQHQNLIAASTIPAIWARHGWDSLQLLGLADNRRGLWIDVGSGAGFPGMAIAIAREEPTLLVEPRRRRADFLREAIVALGLGGRARVVQDRVERIGEKAAVLSARAVAGLERLVEMAHHCATARTRWILPRGHIEPGEIEQMQQRWRFMFHVEQSDVAEPAQIAVLDEVTKR